MLTVLYAVQPGGAADTLVPWPTQAQPAGPWTWTGAYAGVHAGGAWGTNEWNDPFNVFGTTGSFPASGPTGGLLGGAQIGLNYQIRSWVYGIEGDLSWTDLSGNTNCGAGVVGAGWVCNTRATSFATVTARLGYAADRTLLYVKGGYAAAQENHNVQTLPTVFFPNVFAGSNARPGWTVGGGAEYALTPHWTVKAEYNYLSFATQRVNLTDQFNQQVPLDISQNVHVFKIGVNYLFNPAALAWSADAAGYVPTDFRPMPEAVSSWSTEFGARYWYSSGRLQKDLYDPVATSQLNSRLTYANLTGHSVEAFGKLEHRSDVFVKGYFGIGDLTAGKLNDEDFPPAIAPYSNTLSDQRDGRLRYGSADVGYNFWSRRGSKLGAFVGYHYLNERVNAQSCTQVAVNPDVCTAGLVPPGQLTITEAGTWQSLRVGLAGELMFGDRVKLSADAAYLPYVRFNGSDNHWLRPEINALPESGHGDGFQLEAILSYLVTDQFSIGLGGRYWAMRAPGGQTQFPGGLPASPESFKTERYGVFLQAAYRFGADAPVVTKY